MASVKVLILRAAGTNCDLETGHAWEQAGATAERVHLRRVIEKPDLLADYQIVTIPGGFSYGDDIAAGRIFAAQLRRHLGDRLRGFVERGGLVLGICNGFQILVQAGLLPEPTTAASDGGPEPQPVCTIAGNDPPGFQDRWVRLQAGQSPCVFTEPGRVYEMPIAHGEGRVTFREGWDLRHVAEQGLIALRYVPTATRSGDPPRDVDELCWLGVGAGQAESGPPYNPNGSDADIAGLCDPTGRVLGLMPHPERFITATQHPAWTSRDDLAADGPGDGLAIFHRAVAHLA